MNTHDLKYIENFQEAIWHSPIVYEWIRRSMYENINYLEALKQIIVALVNENEELKYKLIQDIMNKSSIE